MVLGFALLTYTNGGEPLPSFLKIMSTPVPMVVTLKNRTWRTFPVYRETTV